MTTTADFYDGRGPSAVWLVSLQGNADPETVRTVACGRLLLDSIDPFTYADAVTTCSTCGSTRTSGTAATRTAAGRWLWPDSHDTDWVFTFVHGRVWITTGRAWLPTRPPVLGYNDNETYNETR